MCRLNPTGALALVAACLTLWGCATGVEPSPDPGLLRVVLQPDPTDTSLVVVNEPVPVGLQDRFDLTVFQGKAFVDTTFFTLYPTPTSYRQEDRRFNVLRRDAAGAFERHVLFESHLPPGRYDHLQFGVTATELKLGSFTIPVRQDPARPLLQDFDVSYDIEPGTTTEVVLEVEPLQSVQRYRNTFLLDTRIEVKEVRLVEPQ